MNKIICILIALPLIISCHNIDLPKSNWCDHLPAYKGFLEIKVSSDRIEVDETEINDIHEIRDFVSQLRGRVEECDGICVSAKIFADKNCPFLRIDSVLHELGKSSIHIVFLKTNEASDSCYIRHVVPPAHIFSDSIHIDAYNEMLQEKDSSRFLFVEKINIDSLRVNTLIKNNNQFDQMLDFKLSKPKNQAFTVLISSKNTYGEIIELMNLYLLKLEFARNGFAKNYYGKPLLELIPKKRITSIT